MASEINNYVGEDFLTYLYVLNSKYEIKAVIDTFSDFLWTERYCGYGEFEITIPVNKELANLCKVDDYVSIRESEVIMVIDTIGLHTDSENGDTMTISGRSLETILDRRIILSQSIGVINDDGTSENIGVQDAIQMILNGSIINPGNSKRRIPNFSFKPSTDPRITRLTMSAFKSRGTNVYDKVLDICQSNHLGFRVNAVDAGGFEFELYFGTDRTYNQESVPVVVFSDSYENLPSSDYLSTLQDHKNVAYVEWDYEYTINRFNFTYNDEGVIVSHVLDPEKMNGSDLTEVDESTASGLRRREIYVNGNTTYDLGTYGAYMPDFPIPSDVPTKDAGIRQATDDGREALSEYQTTEYFDGETNPYRQFIYGADYFIGDIVQLENKYGMTGMCRITEIANSRDGSGATSSITFENIEGDD